MKRIFLLFLMMMWMALGASCGGEPVDPTKQCKSQADCDNSFSCISGQCICKPTELECGGKCLVVVEDPKNCGACGRICENGTICIEGKCKCPQNRILCQGGCVDVLTNGKHCGDCGVECKGSERCTSGSCRDKCPEATPTVCDGGCVNTGDNNLHCGSCGNKCSIDKKCLNGKCVCRGTETLCGNICVNTKSSKKHCGKCSNACGEAQFCASGRCVNSCPRSTPIKCFGGCVDTKSDTNNCGKCGNQCGAGKICLNSNCVCPGDQQECGGTCHDIRTSHAHCGGCGKACPSGYKCYQGRCSIDCPSQTLTACFGGCFETDKDAKHCGGCGKACREGQVCASGNCGCPVDQEQCDKKCVYLETDPNHCGKCKNSCKSGTFCASGKCLSQCPDATPTVCYGGCVDTKKSLRHCGDCGQACAPGLLCKEGSCVCPGGQARCGKSCVDLQSDSLHCGKCDQACPGGKICVKGVCQLKCPDKEQACGEVCVDLQTHARHCGECFQACPTGTKCSAGTCSCTKDQQKCGKTCHDLQTDSAHCGKCDNKCQPGYICQKGGCVRNCQSHLEACGDKCVDLKQDAVNCGKCGQACGLGETCTSGKCQCKQGRTSCSGSCVDLNTDVAHCGKCGQACAKGKHCSGGKCVDCGPTSPKCGSSCCPGGYQCCNNQCVLIKSDERHCGKCGVTCPVGSTCCGGQCVQLQTAQNHCGKCGITCKANESCCGGKCVDLQSDSNSCGTCGLRCSTGEGCCKGACTPTLTDNKNCGTCGNACGNGKGCCAGQCITYQKSVKLPYQGSPKKATELCNNKDDDCDGQVDEQVRRACYDGPKDTRGKGLCKDGTQACQSGVWGACTGTTKPVKEKCNSQDDDCDGTIDQGIHCPWLLRYGSSQRVASAKVTISPKGDVYVTGRFAKDFLVHSLRFPTKGAVDIFVMKLSPGGKSLWAKTFGNTGSSCSIVSTATDSAGHLYILGEFSNSIQLGKTTLRGGSNANQFIAKMSHDGNFAWIRQIQFASGEQGHGNHIVVDKNGKVHVIGSSSSKSLTLGKLNIKNPPLKGSTTPSHMLYLLQLDDKGTITYAKRLVHFGDNKGRFNGSGFIEYSPQGMLYLAFPFTSTSIYIDGVAKVLQTNTKVWLLGISTSGKVNWSTSLRGKPELHGLTLAPTGEVYVYGLHPNGTLQAGKISMVSSSQSRRLFILTANTSGSFVKGFYTFSPVSQTTSKVYMRTDKRGALHIMGHFAGSMLVGTQTLRSTGSTDLYYVVMSKTGAPQGIFSFGGTGAETFYDFRIVSANLVGMGMTTGSFKVNNQTISKKYNSTMFIYNAQP